MVGRYILSVTLDYISKLVPNVFPLSKLRNALKKAAKKFREVPGFDMPSLNKEFYESDQGDGSLTGHGIDDGDFPLDYRNSRLSRTQYLLGEPKDELPTYAYSDIVLEYVNDKARAVDSNMDEPVVFYARPLYETMVKMSNYTKVVLESTTTGMLVNEDGEPISIMSEKDEEEIDKWASADYKTYRDNMQAIANDMAKQGGVPLDRSDAWTKIRKVGVRRMINTIKGINQSIAHWASSPDVLCCLVNILLTIDRQDIKALYSLRMILRWLLNGVDLTLQNLHNALPNLFILIYYGLMSKVLGAFGNLSMQALDEIERVTAKLYTLPEIRTCTPADELMSLLRAEIPGIRQDITDILDSFVNQLEIFQVTYEGTAKQLEARFRISFMYRVVDRIIKALEQGTLCREEIREESLSTPSVPSISPEEVNNFVQNSLSDLIASGDETRRSLAERYGRDPVTGEPVLSDTVMESASEELVSALQDCNKRFSADQLDRITDALRTIGR
jgi:hypothetical protein